MPSWYAEHKSRCIDQGRCVRKGCTATMADGSLLCEVHWLEHKAWNRAWKVRSKSRRPWSQLELLSITMEGYQ